MTALGAMLGVGTLVACCGLLFVLLLVALVIWYWRNQPDQQASAASPEPQIQATIEHPTAATTSEVAPPAPVMPPAPVTPPAPIAPEEPSQGESMPPSADA